VKRGIRVALPGYNALTDTNPDHFALYSDQDWVLIKEVLRGSGTIGLNSTAEITHSLGYIPFFLVYGEVASNEYQASFSYNIYGGWRVYADTTKLYINNFYSATYTHYRYYIFYDDVSI
jgi:hypothetical protein